MKLQTGFSKSHNTNKRFTFVFYIYCVCGQDILENAHHGSYKPVEFSCVSTWDLRKWRAYGWRECISECLQYILAGLLGKKLQNYIGVYNRNTG